MQNFVKSHNKLLLIAVSLAFLLVGVKVLSSRPASLPYPKTDISPTPTPFVEAQRVTLEGVVDCLSHKDTSGPQTLECAIGFRTDDGKSYALDTNLMPQPVLDYTTGDRIQANGIVTPIEALSSDQWQKYDIDGIFSITDSLEVLKSK